MITPPLDSGADVCGICGHAVILGKSQRFGAKVYIYFNNTKLAVFCRAKARGGLARSPLAKANGNEQAEFFSTEG
jgi:hypothetical protein